MQLLILVAVLVLFAIAMVVYFRGREAALEAIDPLPMTLLAKRAWWSLGIGLALTTAIVVVFSIRGFAAYSESREMQFLVLALFIGAVLASLLVDPFGLPGRGNRPTDERDQLVVARAPRAQSVAMILTLAGWVTVLTVSFRGTGAVPMVFVYLIFFSVLIAYALGLSAGILLGYRRMARHGEG